MWSGQIVPTKYVGQAHTTNRDTSAPATAGKRDTRSIRICVPQRTTLFQFNANGIIGEHRPNTEKYQLQGIVGTPLHQWVVPRNVHQSLLLLKCMDQRNRRQRLPYTVYFKHKYITNTTVTTKYKFIQAVNNSQWQLKEN